MAGKELVVDKVEFDFTEHIAKWNLLKAELSGIMARGWEIVENQGAILRQVQADHGREGFQSFCAEVGWSERKGYKLLTLANLKNPLLKKLGTTSAFNLASVVDDDEIDVQLKDDGLWYRGEQKLTMEEFEALSSRKAIELVKQIQKAEKEVEKERELRKKSDDVHKKEVDKLNADLAKTREQVEALTAGEENEYDALLKLAVEKYKEWRELMARLLKAAPGALTEQRLELNTLIGNVQQSAENFGLNLDDMGLD